MNQKKKGTNKMGTKIYINVQKGSKLKNQLNQFEARKQKKMVNPKLNLLITIN